MITSLGYFFGEHASLSSITGVSLTVGAIVIYTLYTKYKKQISKSA
jgi:hypothetical protein